MSATANAYMGGSKGIDEVFLDEIRSQATEHLPACLQVDYVCLQDHHFEPPVIKTHPYERMSHAVLNWAIEHQHDCDVLQVGPCRLACHRPVLLATVFMNIAMRARQYTATST